MHPITGAMDTEGNQLRGAGFTGVHLLLFVLAIGLLALLIPEFVKAHSRSSSGLDRGISPSLGSLGTNDVAPRFEGR